VRKRGSFAEGGILLPAMKGKVGNGGQEKDLRKKEDGDGKVRKGK
jgi:hypothetical protein